MPSVVVFLWGFKVGEEGMQLCAYKKKKMAHFVDNKTECLECTSWVTKLKPVLVIT